MGKCKRACKPAHEEKEIFKNAPTHDKKNKKKKITVDSFTFHSPLFSEDSNFADRQMINKKFTADRHCITTDRKEGYAPNKGLLQWRVTNKFVGLCFLFTFVRWDSDEHLIRH
jgi:hypothetical protein